MKSIHRSIKSLVGSGALLLALSACAAGQPSVHVEPMDSVGPRPVEQQTQSSVIRDYLRAWQALCTASAQNQPDLLDSYFVGQAKTRLTSTIHSQLELGITTSYQDKSHHIKVVFYSPEGLSIQLIDDVEYDVSVHDSARSFDSQRIRARYIAVLTPTESQWKVRIFQGGGM